MNPKRFFILFILVSLLLFGVWLPANAAPITQQVIPTSTPGLDGRILYIAVAGDNCTRVAALNSISIDQLRQLNKNLDEACTIIEGQEYLVGIVSVAGTPTAGPSPTPGLPTVTPTPLTGTTEICILLFEDSNGNALYEVETESAVAGGAVSVTENNGEYSAAQDTVLQADPEAYQGICFSDVPEGSYNITVAIPDNYNPTMELNSLIEVKAGDRAEVGFGVQSKDIVADPGASETNEGGGKSSLLGILGFLFLLGGAAVGYYAWRSGKPESKLSGGMLRKK
ncbi:MAG: LysM peptidoglycan-binding domain-containing protein [Anaerolineales bacterium]|nr:LysM peptidoglycan-binding domain-containing protein [Anaerolineales bacterium]